MIPKTNMNISNLTVFCASKEGNDPIYMKDAKIIGKGLAQRNIELVYGGGSSGLMGAVANAALAAGGKVIGIIPEVLLEWEQYHKNLTELVVTPDMHTRKKLLYERCEAALVLPGGFGTMDELFEMLTWNQLKIHEKRIYLLNSAGFYDSLLQHLRKLQNAGLLYDRLEDRITVCSDPDEVFRVID